MVELNHLFQKDRNKTASAARGTIELNRLFQKGRGKTASAARGTIELNRLFQKGRGKTASAARILSPNPMWQPLSSKSILLLCSKLSEFLQYLNSFSSYKQKMIFFIFYSFLTVYGLFSTFIYLKKCPKYCNTYRQVFSPGKQRYRAFCQCLFKWDGDKS